MADHSLPFSHNLDSSNFHDEGLLNSRYTLTCTKRLGPRLVISERIIVKLTRDGFQGTSGKILYHIPV